MRCSHSDHRREPNRLCEGLEPRTLLGGTGNVVDLNGDVFLVEIIGSGTFTSTLGANGVRLLAFTGTTSATDINITRSSIGEFGDGDLTIHALTTAGDIDEMRTDQFVFFTPEGGQADPGITINGRARVINIAGRVSLSDITITSTGNVNRTSLYINEAEGTFDALQLGEDPDFVEITSGGIIDRLEIDDTNFVRATARRFGIVDFARPDVPGRGNIGFGPFITFEVFATDTNAPYGIKTLEADGSIIDAVIFSNSPVQSILIDELAIFDLNRGTPALQRGDGPPFIGELVVQVNGRLGSFKARTGDFAGSLGAASFGAIEVARFFTGSIAGFVGVNQLGQSQTGGIDSLRVGVLEDSSINASGPGSDGTGFIKSMVIGSIGESIVTTGWIGSCLVSGSGAVFFSSGQVTGSTFTLINTTRARALDTFAVSGNFSNSILRIIDNHAGSIALNGGFSSFSSVQVGVSDIAQAFTGNPFNGHNRSIASLRLKAPAGDIGVFLNGVIAAHTITQATSTLRAVAGAPGSPHGVVADVISSISFRVPNNSLFTTPNTSFVDQGFTIRVI